MRIAVTGANGFVGTALCLHLQKSGIEVVPLTRHAKQAVNYDNPHSLSSMLRGCDCVIHLVAKTHDTNHSPNRNPIAELDAYRAVNVGLSRKITLAAADAKVKRLVFLSSIKVNGESTDTQPFRHTDTPAPTTAYGISKLEAERSLTRLCNQNQMELVIVRAPLIYAPNAKGNINILRKAIKLGLPLPLASLNNRRDLIDLDHLCRLLLQCSQHPDAAGQTLLASNGHPCSTPQLIERLGQDIGKTPRLLPLPTTWLNLLGRLTRQSDTLDKLVGNLEIDSSHTRQLLAREVETV